ncbi:MAG: acylphosphatase [Betaproteobacteria bacterium]|nr:acylphosphatase [Betaproteobacteria bacterium]MBV9360497.1 acylphosphatase [Betaproteobacteria bacterium]
MRTRQIRVSGRVRGVGYRFALRDEARRLGVKGWVRNRADGSVEALLQGDDDALAALVSWAKRGPRAARVDAVRDEPPAVDAAGPFSDFEIRPSA